MNFYRVYAKIDLDAIEHNINILKQKLSTNVKLLFVVKADAYGHGACEISHELEKSADYVGVAEINEALELRKSGVVTVDGSDLVLEMQEKPETPKSTWCAPPFYFYTAADSKKIPEAIAAGCGTDAPGSYISWLCKTSSVHAMEMPGKRYDIGNLESYEEVCRSYKGIE